jgi:phosphocarrier protein FPr
VGRLLWIAPEAHVPSPAGSTGRRDPEGERTRLHEALGAAAAELEELARDTAQRAGPEVGAIFEAQAIFARDPGLVQPALDAIEAGATAEEAIDRAAATQADILAGVEDDYFRERAADLRDVGRRVVDRLTGRVRADLHHRDGAPAVVAADDLDPSVVAALRPGLVTGLALAGGTPNGHAAIVARALDLPLVLGLGAQVGEHLDGLRVVVDGSNGCLLVDPSDGEVAGLLRTAPEPVVAAPGGSTALPVAIEANVGSVAEAELAASAGAEGIGLVRTELLFLGRSVPPGLAEQRSLYARIAAAMGGRPVTFRTLDVGGDKPAGFVSVRPEPNPALGVRGIRLGLRRPELLETQVEALLSSVPGGTLRILLPMVATREEVLAARSIIDGVRDRLAAEGQEAASDVLVGVMIEVPSAALAAGALAPIVDFFSIGTNDLVQYTLAVDRTNPALAELASPFQPAVLRLIASVVDAAAAHGRPVGICGEAAGDPLAAALFVGLGVGGLSVAPRRVGPLREAIAGLDVAACREAAEAALRVVSLAEVQEIAEELAGGRVRPRRSRVPAPARPGAPAAPG